MPNTLMAKGLQSDHNYFKQRKFVATLMPGSIKLAELLVVSTTQHKLRYQVKEKKGIANFLTNSGTLNFILEIKG